MLSKAAAKAKQQRSSPGMKKQSPLPPLRQKTPSVFDLADRLFPPKVQRSFPQPQRVTPRSTPASPEAALVNLLTLNEEQTERESTPDDLNDRLPVDNGSLREAPAATLLPPGANQGAVEEGSDGATPSGVTGENGI